MKRAMAVWSGLLISAIGFHFKVVKDLKASIYYYLESSKKSGDQTDVNVLGTTLKYYF